jgi:hypothetical protein
MKLLLMMLLVTSAWADVSKDEVTQMLEQMVKENAISAHEAQKARIRLQNLSPEEWSQMNVHAKSLATRGPASIGASTDSTKNDLDGAQLKQIEEDIKKFVPQN